MKEEEEGPQADHQPLTSGASAGAAAGAEAAGAAAAAGGEPEATACWRWQLLSFELLPAAAEAPDGGGRALLSQPQREWLQQHVEQRMWAAADVQLLLRHSKRQWVSVPEPPAPPGRRPPAAEAAAAPGSMQGGASPANSQQPSGPAGSVKQESSGWGAGGDGTEAPLPEWASQPLTVLHGVLCQSAARLALWHVLLVGLKRLAEGAWKGCLRLAKATGGDGIRCGGAAPLPQSAVNPASACACVPLPDPPPASSRHPVALRPPRVVWLQLRALAGHALGGLA